MRCTAYCTSSQYALKPLYEYFKTQYPSTLFRDVIHVASIPETKDIFFFSYGVVIFWGLTEEEELGFIQNTKHFESKDNPSFEKDEYDFSYGQVPKIQRDELVLTDKDVLTKLAISYGLAQSSKLTTFENTIDKTIGKTKKLPEDLARKGKISLSRKEISKKIGQLFIDKSSINLHSDILDEPDFFWEYPEHQPLYRDISKCLDVGPRVEVLNNRLEIIGDILEILNDQLNHQHSSILELTIIWLIVIEVVLAVLRDIFHII